MPVSTFVLAWLGCGLIAAIIGLYCDTRRRLRIFKTVTVTIRDLPPFFWWVLLGPAALLMATFFFLAGVISNVIAKYGDVVLYRGEKK